VDERSRAGQSKASTSSDKESSLCFRRKETPSIPGGGSVSDEGAVLRYRRISSPPHGSLSLHGRRRSTTLKVPRTSGKCFRLPNGTINKRLNQISLPNLPGSSIGGASGGRCDAARKQSDDGAPGGRRAPGTSRLIESRLRALRSFSISLRILSPTNPPRCVLGCGATGSRSGRRLHL
jgi:hypothetical protein